MQAKTLREQYDLIIVGAGTSGCIIAAHVAERGVRARDGEPLRIALIEAGPHLEGSLNPGYGAVSRRAMFTNISNDESGRWVWPWPEAAKMVGGCSMHWGNNAYAPYDMDYTHWMNETGVDWSKDKFKDAVEEITREYNIGEVPDETYSIGNRMFKQAVESMGHKTSYVPSGRKNCIFCGYCGDGNFCKYDSKANVLPYLERALRKGVELFPDALVQRVTIEKRGERGIAQGVVLTLKDGSTREVKADRVLVSCGTYGTPVLLARSGYGPREQLGDKALVHNPNIGQNLEIQPGHDVWAYYDADVKTERGAGNNGHYFWPETTADGYNVVTLRSTILSFPNYPQAAALRSFAPRFGQAHKEFMRSAVRRVGGVRSSILTPLVKGSINVITGDTTYPYSDPRNVKRLHWAAEIMREIHKKMGAKKIEEQLPTSFRGGHPTGTCRAGADPKTSVVDPHFRSHDVENLLICDGSVIPRSCLGHKHIPVSVTAAFAARRIVADYFKRG